MAGKTPSQLASDAADAVRAINHLTRSPRDGFEYPGDVYSLVAGLSQMAAMLPQALDQAARLIVDLHEAGHLRSDKDQLGTTSARRTRAWSRRALRPTSCTAP
ncbi:hypothetical protein ACFW6S_31530 [Streptomyces sp. NPDC058740]|uniref:hypothetical protein n=1 Tax=Streptomyces sp. NPDC058740 TaxID=3346619 RepID=UPI0036CBEBC6